MPFRRRRVVRRRNPRSRYTRTVRRAAKRVARRNIPRPLALRSKWENPLSQTRMVKFKYSDTAFDMSTALGNGYNAAYTFRLNSLFDPDLTGVGVQPYGYDQMSGLFGYYRVYASKITVRPFITDASQVRKVIVSVFPHYASNPSYVDASDLRVTPFSRQKTLSSVEGITRHNYLTKYISVRKLLRGEGASEQDYTAAVGANPVRAVYWKVYVNTNDIAQAVGVQMDVDITYYCKLWKSDTVNES